MSAFAIPIGHLLAQAIAQQRRKQCGLSCFEKAKYLPTPPFIIINAKFKVIVVLTTSNLTSNFLLLPQKNSRP
jgi:hypothetical protein